MRLYIGMLGIILLTINPNVVEGTELLDSYARNLGFNDWQHLEQTKNYCMKLYSVNVDMNQLSERCDLYDMKCYQEQAQKISSASNRLINSNEWVKAGCNRVPYKVFSGGGSGDCDNEEGEVIKDDVCGSGNSIIETRSGWYVAAEHYSGVYLYEGDIVCGELTSYGFQEICRNDDCGNFYIEDYESSLNAAYEELCD